MIDPAETALTPPVAEEILATLKDFDTVYTPASGAVLYPSRLNGSSVADNLWSAAIAGTLGLLSVDYERRTYLPKRPRNAPASLLAYQKALGLSRAHLEQARAALPYDSSRSVSFGTYSATVALQRAIAGFDAAEVLYRIGFNFEGDAVIRQVLEQVAWGFVAGGAEDRASVEKISSSGSITALRKGLVPYSGRLYGALSHSVHAGLDQHQQVYLESPTGADSVLIAWSRLSASAANHLLVADAWVATWEHVQFEFFTSRQALDHDGRLISERAFIKDAIAAVAAIDAVVED